MILKTNFGNLSSRTLQKCSPKIFWTEKNPNEQLKLNISWFIFLFLMPRWNFYGSGPDCANLITINITNL